MKCETCEELNEETNDVYIDDIYIQGAGFYHWRREIIYCPTCGKRIKHRRVNYEYEDQRTGTEIFGKTHRGEI